MLAEMNAASLPARIAYAVIALPVGGLAGFYACIWLLPLLVKYFSGSDWDVEDFRLFQGALAVGAGLAFTAALLALTLPWKRQRRRGGRRSRIAVACVLVVFTSLVFAEEVRSLIYDLLFAAWLAYTMALTFVRYGIVDSRERRSAAGGEVGEDVVSEEDAG